MKKHLENHREYVSFDVWKRKSLANPAFVHAYDALQPKYAIIRAIIDARIKKGFTQEDIARRAGTTQSAIARFESGTSNPTLEFLSKVAHAVGVQLEIRLART